MKILFTKFSDEEHRVKVIRDDGSEDQTTLVSRSFLRHDFAHLAAEQCVEIENGFWGLVAKGAALDGEGIGGPKIQLAESLAGPIQTLMRLNAPVEKFESYLSHLLPDRNCSQLAIEIKEKGRQLEGHWRATPFGETMEVEW